MCVVYGLRFLISLNGLFVPPFDAALHVYKDTKEKEKKERESKSCRVKPRPCPPKANNEKAHVDFLCQYESLCFCFAALCFTVCLPLLR